MVLQEYRSSVGTMHFPGIMYMNRVKKEDHCSCNTTELISMFSRIALRRKEKMDTQSKEYNR